MLNSDELHTILLVVVAIGMIVLAFHYISLGGDGGCLEATFAALGALVGVTLGINTKPPAGA